VPNVELRKDWFASPLLALSLKGLPPSLILVEGLDALNGEGEAYAARLREVGITTIVKLIWARCTASCPTRSCCPRRTMRLRISRR
jgi:acetyl esterase/lipase